MTRRSRFPLAGSARGIVVSAALLSLAAACQHSRPPAPGAPSGRAVEVGYGARQQRDVTGAVSSLDEKHLRHLRVSHVAELLEGRVPGLLVNRLPNGDFTLQIRGARSLTGDNQPLVVIDGIPASQHALRAALSMLAPQQVRRIDVLRGGAAAAVYGSRGANGVILITTRRAS